MIAERTTPSEAARQMVDVVLLAIELGAERVELAVRGTLTAGAYDGRAVALLARKVERPAAEPLAALGAGLTRAEAPPPNDLADYDRLLGAGQAS